MVLSERQNDLLCRESWYQDGDSYRAKAEHSVCGRNVYILCREITLTLGFRSNSTGLYISFCSWAVTMEKDPWKCRFWSTEPFPVTAFIHHDMLCSTFTIARGDELAAPCCSESHRLCCRDTFPNASARSATTPVLRGISFLSLPSSSWWNT